MLILLVLVMVLGAIMSGGGDSASDATTPNLGPADTMTTVPDSTQEPVFEAPPVDTALAQDLAQLASGPARATITDTSTEGIRTYYTWNRPDLGASVKGVRIGPDDWWIKITGRAVGVSQLTGPTDLREIGSNGVATSYEVVSGPLKGLILIESDPTLHVYSRAFYDRVQ